VSALGLALGLSALPTLGAEAPAAADYERPPTLAASQLVPEKLLSGRSFRVDPEVPTDGLLGLFTVRGAVGRFQVLGIDLLETRVAEIPAIERLKGMSRSKVFTRALGAAAARPLRAAGNMARHPMDTAKGVPGGVSRFFDRVGSGGKRLVAAATDPKADTGRRSATVAGQTGAATRDALGYEQERRLLAKEMKVDPYTTNPVLAKQLDEVAWVSFTGRIGVGTLMAVVVPGSFALGATSFANDLVWDTPRADLVVRNQKGLAALGVRAAQAQSFMKNPAFSLSVQTALVADLQKLSGVEGRAEVITLAGTVASEEQARFVANAVRLLVQHHETRSPLATVSARGTVVGRERGGAVVVPGPVDYVSWTEKVATFARREDLAAPTRSLWGTGRVSPRARKEFEALGWTVHEGGPTEARKGAD
jgi:hypothetical protein